MDLDANVLKLGNVISLFSEGNDISEGMRILLYHNVTDYLGNSQKLWKFSDCLSRVHAKEKALQKFNKKLAAKKEQADAEPEVIIHSLCYAAPRSVTWGDYLLIPLALYSTLGDYLLIPLALYLTGVIIHFRSLALSGEVGGAEREITERYSAHPERCTDTEKEQRVA